MASRSPKVSVIMASYNHGGYVAAALQSVLDQSFQDCEIVVTDDGSSDDSVEVIRSIDDPRIKLYCFESNQGACAATNNCIRRATGKYIAVMNSDDLWCPEKLRKQLEILETDPDVAAVFTNAQFVREDGSEFAVQDRPDFFDVFSQQDRSRGAWLKSLFYGGNCLCHPSILIRRACYDVLGLYNNNYRQLPDYDMWIRFCKHFDLQVNPEKLVRFRLLQPGMNASSQVGKNAIRTINEHYLIAKHYFDGVSQDAYRDAFASDLINPEFVGDDEFECEKALLFLRAETHLGRVYKWVALEQLFELINSPSTAEILSRKYHFDNKAFIEFSSTLDFLIERPATAHQLEPQVPALEQGSVEPGPSTGILVERNDALVSAARQALMEVEQTPSAETKTMSSSEMTGLSGELLFDELIRRIRHAPVEKLAQKAGGKMWRALTGRR